MGPNKLLGTIAFNYKQGRSSYIGTKILSVVLRQLTDDLKKENNEKELSYIENQSYILLNNNLKYFVCSAELLYQCVKRNLFCFSTHYIYLRGANQGSPKKYF